MNTYSETLDMLNWLSKDLFDFRREQGLSQRQISRLSGVSFSTVSRIESGHGYTVESACKVMRLMDAYP